MRMSILTKTEIFGHKSGPRVVSSVLPPDNFHFMLYVRCPDVGIDCSGYGEVTLKVDVVERIHKAERHKNGG